MGALEKQVRRRVSELSEYTSTRTIDGVFVRSRCYAVNDGGKIRYEVMLDGHGQYAVVDVARRADIVPRIEQAVVGFAMAARVRSLPQAPGD
jgi:hypothetical protein